MSVTPQKLSQWLPCSASPDPSAPTTPVLEVAVAEVDTTQGRGETQNEAGKAEVKV